MAGANYMGGKRNAAKARTKDSTYRLHKEHFKKQRTDFLVCGLGSRNAARHRKNPIDFSHAQHELQPYGDLLPPSHAVTRQRSLGSSPVLQHGVHSISPKPIKSKLLAALENNEPVSYRSKKERLLKITDFAGISPVKKEVQPCVSQTKKLICSDDPQLPKYHNEKETKVAPTRDAICGSPGTDFQALSHKQATSSTPLHLFGTFQDLSESFSFVTVDHDTSLLHEGDSASHDFDVGDSPASDLIESPCERRHTLQRRDRRSERDSVESKTSITFNVPKGTETNDDLFHHQATLKRQIPCVQFSAYDLEMSADWFFMADALQLPRFKDPGEKFFKERRSLERAGVDFYLSPDSRDGKYKLGDKIHVFSSTNEPLCDSLAEKFWGTSSNAIDTSADALTFKSGTPDEKDSCTVSSRLTAKTSPFIPCAPLSTMEFLEYDTQSDDPNGILAHPEPTIGAIMECLIEEPNESVDVFPAAAQESPDSGEALTPEILSQCTISSQPLACVMQGLDERLMLGAVPIDAKQPRIAQDSELPESRLPKMMTTAQYPPIPSMTCVTDDDGAGTTTPLKTARLSATPSTSSPTCHEGNCAKQPVQWLSHKDIPHVFEITPETPAHTEHVSSRNSPANMSSKQSGGVVMPDNQRGIQGPHTVECAPARVDERVACNSREIVEVHGQRFIDGPLLFEPEFGEE